ncbi:hypothetical protein GCM10010360_25910 [Streptomyces nogalater]
MHDGHEARVGGLTLTTLAVEHGIPAFAVRIEAGGRSLVCSGDTAPCANLTRLAEGCGALLCEAESSQAPTDGPQAHHTPEDTGDTARAAGAGRLLVTHVGPTLTPGEAVRRASARYHGPVDYAAPGTTFSIA